jgi:hypothetical protein
MDHEPSTLNLHWSPRLHCIRAMDISYIVTTGPVQLYRALTGSCFNLFRYFRMNGPTSTIGSILEEVERVVSGFDYDEAGYGDEDDDIYDEIGESRRPALIVSGSSDVEEGNSYTESDFKTRKPRSWKKPKDKPKRPLSAYNLFFQLERERIITGDEVKEVNPEDVTNVCVQHKKKKEKRRHRKTHGVIGFADLARAIANRWKTLDKPSRRVYDDCAAIEKARYQREVAEWVKRQEAIEKIAAEEISFQRPLQQARKMPPKPPMPPPSPPPVSPMTMHQQSMTNIFQQQQQQQQQHQSVSPIKMHQQSMANIYQQRQQQHQPASVPPNTLHRLIASGRSYMHYQGLIEQQRQLVEEEIAQKRLVEETQRQLMMSYQGQGTPFLGQANLPPFYGRPAYEDYHDTGPCDYYGMADQSFQMAQMTLPTPARSMNPHFPMGMGPTGPMGMGPMDIGMMANVNRVNRLYDQQSFFEPLGQVSEVTPPRMPTQPQHGGEEVMLDPHTGLSSPTFGSTREDPESARMELSQLLDSFENAAP